MARRTRVCVRSGGSQSSCPAKAGHPVFQSTSNNSICHGVLDRPPSRTMTAALDLTPQIPSWSPPMTNQPFFTRDRDAFVPTQAANGPWDSKSLHGRVIIGLLAFVIGQRHGSDDFVPA